ncbi:hypothetical protein RHMOL_Rhmol01G0233800 [Rhododendron molle]|uniref:Uncharacterized protein n=1 Tax=Rhododendron molle TaxID=49168 RepID=A0ACC0Q5X8_RHOML|nr:hypothetical protein RHMOL_Rhmol01G0233800 [Rhododendron molle]
MEPELEDQTVTEEVVGESAVAVGSGNGGGNKVVEVNDEPVRRAPVDDPHAPVTSGAVGLVLRLLDPSMTVEGTVITGRGSNSIDSSGAGSSDIGPSGSLLRDSARGKEFVDDTTLSRSLQDNPTIVAAVVVAREERQKTIALALEEERLKDEAERARAEGEDALREMEAAERELEQRKSCQEYQQRQWRRVSSVPPFKQRRTCLLRHTCSAIVSCIDWTTMLSLF